MVKSSLYLSFDCEEGIADVISVLHSNESPRHEALTFLLL